MKTLVRFLAPCLMTLSAGAVLHAQDAHKVGSLTEMSGAIRDLTDHVSPAVVEVFMTGYGSTDDSGRVSNQISRRQTSGSGVIVDPAGFIMTNAHVVQGAISLKVLMPLNRSERAAHRPAQFSARVLGMDRESDLALLKVDAEGLPSLQFADSDRLRQGDLVFAVGSPLGLENSVSMGLVSATGRAVNPENTILYIQTDASINPGNSGGALVNTDGLLIGVNSFIASESGGNEGIGFAIPSNVVRNVYMQLRRKGRVSRGSIGVSVQNLTPLLAKGLGLQQDHGIVISDVAREGAGGRAGLKRKDIILALNGTEMLSERQFEADISRRAGNESIKLSILRGDDRLTVTAEVDEQTAPWDPLADMVSPERNLVPRLGILCVEIDRRVEELLPELRRKYGLLVAAKSPEGQAQFVDLQPGDIIHEINNLPVAWLATFQKMIDEFKRGDSVVLLIERDGRYRYVAFEIE